MNASATLVEAAARPGVITATFPIHVDVEAAEASPGARRITGVGVPWNVEGRVSSGDVVVFHPGSLNASSRPVSLRDHDRQRTIGRVVDANDDGAAMNVAVRVSQTPLGDETLALAADGALMFSVGAEPTQYEYDDRGVLHVYAAEWTEQTLLPIGAYRGAVITSVAAELGDDDSDDGSGEEGEGEGDEGEGDEGEAGEGEAGDEGARPVEGARAVPLAGNRRRGRRRGRFESVTLSDLAHVIAASRGADPRQVRQRDAILAAQGVGVRGVEAALADITLVGVDNIAPAYRPAYQAELVDIISWGTPTIDVLRPGDLERGDYPNKTFNSWAKTPEVALQANEKDEIHSVPVSIVPSSAPVKTWAGGNDISQQTLDFGSPSFVEDYIRAAGLDYAQQSDTYAVTGLLAAATNVPLGVGDSFITVVGKLIGALSPATTPPGGLFLALAYNLAVGLIGVTRDEGPAFWDGQVNFGRMTPEVTNDAGLTVYCDPNLPADTYLAGHRQGATWYDLPGTPFNLRAVNVGLLGLDVAVYGYGALGIQYPGAFTKATTNPGP